MCCLFQHCTHLTFVAHSRIVLTNLYDICSSFNSLAYLICVTHLNVGLAYERVTNVKPAKLLNDLQMLNKNNTGMSYKCQIRIILETHLTFVAHSRIVLTNLYDICSSFNSLAYLIFVTHLNVGLAYI
jgi:hypothetical protein